MTKLTIFILLIWCASSCAATEAVNMINVRDRLTYKFSEQVTINYEEHGNFEETMVFLHGFGASIETWRDIQAGLQNKYKLFFLDLKGFGLSSKPDDGKYSLEDHAEIVLAFIRDKKLTNVTLVGHSYGGAVSLVTYIKAKREGNEHIIRRMILVDSAAYLQDFPFFIKVLRKPFINWIVMNIVPSRMRASYTLRRLFHDPEKVSEKIIERYATFFNQPNSYNSFVESAEQILPQNPEAIIEDIKKIHVPSLILWGENDTVIPVEHAYRLNLDIRNSSLVIIPACGHIPHEEKPEESLKAIVNFMEK